MNVICDQQAEVVSLFRFCLWIPIPLGLLVLNRLFYSSDISYRIISDYIPVLSWDFVITNLAIDFRNMSVLPLNVVLEKSWIQRLEKCHLLLKLYKYSWSEEPLNWWTKMWFNIEINQLLVHWSISLSLS